LPLVFAGRRLALVYQAYSPHFFGALVMLIALVLVAVRMKAAELHDANAAVSVRCQDVVKR
jgi:hypothetical protein